jgi:type II secretory pathway pseudopilin PulG
MSPRVARWAWGLLLGSCAFAVSLTVLQSGRAQVASSKPVEELLPRDTVLLIRWDGSERHAASYQKTAAYEALYESGLMPLVEKTLSQITASSGEKDETQQLLLSLIEAISKQGVSISVTLPPPAPGGPPMPLPQALIVIPDSGKHAGTIIGMANGGPRLQIETREVSDRTVWTTLIPDTPGVEVSLWNEGGHLAISAGIGALQNHLAVASGDAPNLTASALWEEFGPDNADYDQTTLFWFDIGAIRDTFAPMPLPVPVPGPDGGPMTIADAAKSLGLDNLGAIVSESGHRDRALWSETTVQIDGERRGLLALMDHEKITLDDLPPLPADTTAFAATSFSLAKFYDDILASVREGMKAAPPEVQQQFEQQIGALPLMIGFDPKADLFDALGNVISPFVESGQNFLWIGGWGVAIEVKDAEKLRRTVNQILAMGQAMSDGEFEAIRTEKHGREIITFRVEDAEAGGLVVDDNWLVIGLVPQTVESFLLRVDGKLPSWTPSREIAAALESMPKEFTSIAVSNPRATYRTVLAYAPLLAIGAQQAINESGVFPPGTELPLKLADIPPTELVVQPLFPNVIIGTSNENGFQWYSRASMPSIPFIGGAGSVATVGVATALLLPAVQQARSAARRSQSKNNLKQIGLSLHNYHDVYRAFPAGTIEESAEKPEDRLSWIVSVLPFLDQAPLFDVIDREAAWNSQQNQRATNTALPVLNNPQDLDAVPWNTDYIGMAGLGKGAEDLPVTSPRAGVFGTNRKTRIRDIRDGTSNTIAVTETSGGHGPWAQGGRSTIRPLTQKPYINGPDGIGGPFIGGVQVLFTDGSVRFISENIDPKVFEAMMTINGNEAIPQF